jgi:hypothetical protein
MHAMIECEEGNLEKLRQQKARPHARLINRESESAAMSKVPDLRDVPELPDEIIQAGLNGELVLFVGAGASIMLALPSWTDLASNALRILQQKGCLNFSELEQLKHLDPKKQLSIAKLIAEENGHELKLDEYFKEIVKDKIEGNSIYKSINDIITMNSCHRGSAKPVTI